MRCLLRLRVRSAFGVQVGVEVEVVIDVVVVAEVKVEVEVQVEVPCIPRFDVEVGVDVLVGFVFNEEDEVVCPL